MDRRRLAIGGAIARSGRKKSHRRQPEFLVGDLFRQRAIGRGELLVFINPQRFQLARFRPPAQGDDSLSAIDQKLLTQIGGAGIFSHYCFLNLTSIVAICLRGRRTLRNVFGLWFLYHSRRVLQGFIHALQ